MQILQATNYVGNAPNLFCIASCANQPSLCLMGTVNTFEKYQFQPDKLQTVLIIDPVLRKYPKLTQSSLHMGQNE